MPQSAGVSLFLPVTTNGTGVDPSQPTAFADFELRVNQTGLQRITYEQLKSAGLDLTGVSISGIALLKRGLPVPLYVYSRTNTFGAGSYIEFQGEALNTLYTHTNVYILRVNQSQAMRPTTDSRTPPTGAPVSSYIETAATELSNEYNSLSPTGEPWFDEMFIAGPTSPQTENRTMAIDNLGW